MHADASDPTVDQTPAAWSTYAGSYDEWLAPNTERFAADLIDLLGIAPGRRALDVAAGSGAFALAAARAGAEVLATDFAPGMVELLRTKAAGLPIRAEVMDGQSLALPDACFDVAVSVFGLIFFPDVAAGAAELHRVLVPGGRAAVVAWGSDGFAVHRTALEALARAGVERPERSTLPAAFRLSDPARLEALMTDAGFADVEVHPLEHRWPVPDPAALFRSLPTWSAPLRPLFERLTAAEHAAGTAAFARLVAEQSDSDGLPLHALAVTGTR